jgi:hypothetical protein
MKKLFLVLLLVLGLVGYVYADTLVTSATRARAAALDKGIQQVVAIGDVSDGYTQEVDSHGAASVMEYPKKVATSEGTALNTGADLTGAASRIYSITFGGYTTAAKDYVLVYDAATATGTAKFEVSVDTAGGTNHLALPGGVIFSTGCFVDANAATGKVTVTYDN